MRHSGQRIIWQRVSAGSWLKYSDCPDPAQVGMGGTTGEVYAERANREEQQGLKW